MSTEGSNSVHPDIEGLTHQAISVTSCVHYQVSDMLSAYSLFDWHTVLSPLRTVSPTLYSGLTWRNRKTKMWHFRHCNQRPHSAPTIHLSHILGSHFHTREVKNALGPKRPCLDVYKYSDRTVHWLCTTGFAFLFIFSFKCGQSFHLFVGGPRCRSAGYRNILSSNTGLSTVANCIVIVILEALGCHKSVIEDSGLKGRNTASLSKWFPTFRLNVFPSWSSHAPRFRVSS